MRNNNRKPQANYSSAPVAKPLPIGTKVYVNVTHSPTKNVYLCEARIIRLPKSKADTRYKVLVTGVKLVSGVPASILDSLIGMKIVRQKSSMALDEPWKNSQNEWKTVQEPAATRLVRQAVTFIRKEAYKQSKNRPVPRLD